MGVAYSTELWNNSPLGWQVLFNGTCDELHDKLTHWPEVVIFTIILASIIGLC